MSDEIIGFKTVSDSPASENDRLQVALDGWRLRAQALALVLIERASR